MSESSDGLSFEALLAAELPKLKAAALKQVRPEGEVFFQEGDVGDGMYLIESGAVEIAAEVGNGQHRMLTMLRAGAVFGEMAVLDNQPRSAMAIASLVTLMVRSRSRLTRYTNAAKKKLRATMLGRPSSRAQARALSVSAAARSR